MVSQHALQVSRPTPRGQVEGSGQGASPGPHPGGCIPACTEADPPNGYCCGRYASYWNAFFFYMWWALALHRLVHWRYTSWHSGVTQVGALALHKLALWYYTSWRSGILFLLPANELTASGKIMFLVLPVREMVGGGGLCDRWTGPSEASLLDMGPHNPNLRKLQLVCISYTNHFI